MYPEYFVEFAKKSTWLDRTVELQAFKWMVKAVSGDSSLIGLIAHDRE